MWCSCIPGTDVILKKWVPQSCTAGKGAMEGTSLLLEMPPKTVKKGEKCPGISHPPLVSAFHWLNPSGSQMTGGSGRQSLKIHVPPNTHGSRQSREKTRDV